MYVLKLTVLYILQPVAGLFPHALLMSLACLAGRLLMYGKSATIMKREVSRMLGSGVSREEVDAIVLEGLQNNQKDLFEIWSFPRMNKRKIRQITYIEHQKYIDEALRAGKGAVVGVTHFGSWKIIIAALGYGDYPTYQIAVDPLHYRDPSMRSYHNKIMEIERRCEDSLPAQFLYVDKFLRGLYKAFKANALVINSLDGLVRKEAVDLVLLHTVVPVDKAAVSLAYRFQAPLIPIFAIRQKDNRHKIVVHKPIVFDRELEDKDAVHKAFVEFMKIFTSHVKEHPSHYVRILYQLVHDRERGMT